MVVIAIIAILAAMLLPALGKAKQKAQGIGCINNNKQLITAWHMYSLDFQDHVANNYTIPGTINTITDGKFENWVNNVISWGVNGDGPNGATSDQSNTNVAWVKNGVLGRYTAGAVGVYKCPADNYLSPRQSRAGWSMRLRSNSMNALIGLTSDTPDMTYSGQAWFNQSYRQYLKQSDFLSPSMTWVTVDEHPDSINDGFFIVSVDASLNATEWGDTPASYHNGACGFSFADGHAEVHKWRSATSVVPVKYSNSGALTQPFDALGLQDYAWYKLRTGFVLFR